MRFFVGSDSIQREREGEREGEVAIDEMNGEYLMVLIDE